MQISLKTYQVLYNYRRSVGAKLNSTPNAKSIYQVLSFGDGRRPGCMIRRIALDLRYDQMSVQCCGAGNAVQFSGAIRPIHARRGCRHANVLRGGVTCVVFCAGLRVAAADSVAPTVVEVLLSLSFYKLFCQPLR